MTCKSSGLAAFTALCTSMVGAFVALAVSAQQAALPANPHADVLSIGGSVTEIVVALGQQHRLKARDTTSTYPPAISELPDVG
jgi:iron complex transport system substrate-binding protein